MSDDDGWLKPLLASVGALAGVALLVGLVVGVVALGLAGRLGFTGGAGGAHAERSLFIPPLVKTTMPDPEGMDAPTPTIRAATEPSEAAPRPRKEREIVLGRPPHSVAALERIDLTGSYVRGDGRTLQVQRFEGGWSDFPVTVTVRGGGFSTYVQTGKSGPNRFRLVDPGTGLASNPVTVTVG